MSGVRAIAGSVAALGLVAAVGAVHAEPKAGGLLAFSREGNVYVYDFTDDQERQLTSDGVPMGTKGVTYGCPTLTDWSVLVFLSVETDADGTPGASRWYMIDPAGGSARETLGEDDVPLGLGYCPDTRTLYTLHLPDKVGPGEDRFGATIALRAEFEGRRWSTRPTTWYGDVGLDNCRVHIPRSLHPTMVSMPGFPTDVSSAYGLYALATGDEIPLLTEEQLGANTVVGIDFAGADTIYAAVAAPVGEAPLTPGLYTFDPAGPTPTLIAQVREPKSLAVSNAQRYAAIGCMDGALWLVDLDTKQPRRLTTGEDPDFFPK